MVTAEIQPQIDEVRQKLDNVKFTDNIQTQKDCIFLFF